MHTYLHNLAVIGGIVAIVLVFAADTASAQGRLEPRQDDETFESEDEDMTDEVDEEEEGDDDERDYGDDELPVPVLFGAPIDGQYSTFGDPRGGGSRDHEGFDILAPAGTPIVSPVEGEVKRIGTYRGAGRFVIVETDDDRELRFYHMEDQADYLDEGDDVDVGELLGFVGSSGNAIASAPHLHLEIRDDDDLIDPFDVITEDFTLAEKMEILDDAFADADDPDELAEFLTSEFSGVFAQAVRAGIDIPDEMEDELPDGFAEISVPAQNLSVGSRGSAVSDLQQILIDSGDLTRVSAPTGYFGPITETALASYQSKNGISPASGNYGPITRSYLAGDESGASDFTTQTDAQLRERILRLKQQVQELEAALAS